MAVRKNSTSDPNLLRYAGMGMELAAAAAGGYLLGWYIDRRFETRYGAVIGAAVGIVGGLYNLIKQSLTLIKKQNKRDTSDDNLDGAA